MKRIVAIIQARMGSTRLPGKVMLDLGGDSVLARVVRRVQRSRQIAECVVATSVSGSDDVVARESTRLGVNCFRGDEQDVLDRYYRAAQTCGADVVVRITADCPLIDPGIIDKTITAFLAQPCDYASNALVRTYPRGLDTEVFLRSALDRAWEEAHELYERVHVTPFLYQHPERFRVLSVESEKNYSSYRWTLDTPADLRLLEKIYERFPGTDSFGWTEVLALLEREPELAAINADVRQKLLHEG